VPRHAYRSPYAVVPTRPRYRWSDLKSAYLLGEDALEDEIRAQVTRVVRGRASSPAEVAVLRVWSHGEMARLWNDVCERAENEGWRGSEDADGDVADAA
jgi:hypothetical protein